MHHELKLLSPYFEQVIQGNKPFEIRDNSDRNFQEGDTVTLNEFTGERYTGRKVGRQITYVTGYAQQPGFVVFGMKPIDEVLDACQADQLMTLDEAIAHALDLGINLRGGCAVQHLQLAAWLQELSLYREDDA